MTEKRKIVLITTVLAVTLLSWFFLAYAIIFAQKIEVQQIPVAKKTLAPRTRITAEDLTMIDVPKTYISANTLTKPEDIVGKYTQIYGFVPQGSPFFSEMLEKAVNLADYPSLLLKQGQVSYSLLSDLAKSAGNSLVAGQKVDLYVTVNLKDQPPITDCLVKAVRIIAVKDRSGMDVDRGKGTKIPYVILIAIDEGLVKYLKAAGKLGSIELLAVNANYAEDQECLLQADSPLLEYLLNE